MRYKPTFLLILLALSCLSVFAQDLKMREFPTWKYLARSTPEKDKPIDHWYFRLPALDEIIEWNKTLRPRYDKLRLTEKERKEPKNQFRQFQRQFRLLFIKSSQSDGVISYILFECNCTERSYRLLHASDEAFKFDAVTSDAEKEWQEVAPESMLDIGLNEICQWL